MRKMITWLWLALGLWGVAMGLAPMAAAWRVGEPRAPTIALEDVERVETAMRPHCRAADSLMKAEDFSSSFSSFLDEENCLDEKVIGRKQWKQYQEANSQYEHAIRRGVDFLVVSAVWLIVGVVISDKLSDRANTGTVTMGRVGWSAITRSPLIRWWLAGSVAWIIASGTWVAVTNWNAFRMFPDEDLALMFLPPLAAAVILPVLGWAARR